MNYTLGMKKSLIQRYQEGESVSSLVRDYKIARSTIYNWIDLLVDKNTEELKISKCQLLADKMKLKRVINENEILSFVLSNLDIPKRRKIVFAHMLYDKEYPIASICRAVGISKSAYYHDKNRKPKTYIIDEDDDKFRPLIKKIFEESKGRFGGRKIKIQLNKDDHIISYKRIIRLMKEMNLVVNQPDDNYNNYHKRKYSYKPNIISKSEHYPNLNKIWVSDITYIRVRKEHYYLFAIIDLYSRRVIGHTLSKSLEAHVLVNLMKRTFIHRCSPSNLIFHSDQGLQYTAKSFRNFLDQNNITQSFSKKGCPYDNSVAESFFASLKKEEIYRHIYNSYNHLEEAIDEYIVFFNMDRPHASLRYKTPFEYETTAK